MQRRRAEAGEQEICAGSECKHKQSNFTSAGYLSAGSGFEGKHEKIVNVKSISDAIRMKSTLLNNGSKKRSISLIVHQDIREGRTKIRSSDSFNRSHFPHGAHVCVRHHLVGITVVCRGVQRPSCCHHVTPCTLLSDICVWNILYSTHNLSILSII